MNMNVNDPRRFQMNRGHPNLESMRQFEHELQRISFFVQQFGGKNIQTPGIQASRESIIRLYTQYMRANAIKKLPDDFLRVLNQSNDHKVRFQPEIRNLVPVSFKNTLAEEIEALKIAPYVGQDYFSNNPHIWQFSERLPTYSEQAELRRNAGETIGPKLEGIKHTYPEINAPPLGENVPDDDEHKRDEESSSDTDEEESVCETESSFEESIKSLFDKPENGGLEERAYIEDDRGSGELSSREEAKTSSITPMHPCGYSKMSESETAATSDAETNKRVGIGEPKTTSTKFKSNNERLRVFNKLTNFPLRPQDLENAKREFAIKKLRDDIVKNEVMHCQGCRLAFSNSPSEDERRFFPPSYFTCDDYKRESKKEKNEEMNNMGDIDLYKYLPKDLIEEIFG